MTGTMVKTVHGARLFGKAPGPRTNRVPAFETSQKPLAPP